VRQLRSDMANIDKLEDGEEGVYAVLEGYVDLQPGDRFEEKVNNAEIGIKDGEVVELRNA